ncbi:NAD(P)/FAD-dependent oxidoreductase [Planococcus sp. 1R117A]|uniref:NAD(P)/FAD-dependent oxidoreductase n=1 Tax=Planococcus sp. 1R117A TaxID=3447020 RepID=UPI003EDC6615
MSGKMMDITIIGGGPVGMFSAFYAGMRGMKVKIIESLPQLGGQLSALYPEKYIYDIAGLPKVKAQDLINNLSEQMSAFPVELALNETVQEVERQEDNNFKLKTNAGIHYTKTILITAGNGAFNFRKLEVEGEEIYDNIHYFVNNLEQFRNRRLAVFGGGDSAVDWALMLEPIAESVKIIHRRDKFRAHEHSVSQLETSNVEKLTPYKLHELIGGNSAELIRLKHAKENITMELEVDDILVNYGFVSSLGHISSWSLNIEGNSIVVNSRMETNIPGIYATGDICTYEGKVKLIASGFGEAPVAISNAKVYIDPNSSFHPLHSTTIMEQKEAALNTVK